MWRVAILTAMALIALGAPAPRAESIEDLSREFGAYDPAKGQQMVAQCEAQATKLREGKPAFDAAAARFARADKEYRRLNDEHTRAQQAIFERRNEYAAVVQEANRLSAQCSFEQSRNPSTPRGEVAACVQYDTFVRAVLEPRKARHDQAEAEFKRLGEAWWATGREIDQSRQALAAERSKLGLGDAESVDTALARTEERCRRLRAWAALGARAQQREQDELYQKGNAAYGQCDFAAVERVIAQMAPGAQRGALESALRTARAREAEMRAAYQRGQAFVTEGNNALRQGRPAEARSLYEKALQELQAARQNALCAKDQATIDVAIGAVQRNIARTAAAPAPPSPSSSTRSASGDDQYCRDLYSRGQAENRNGRALYQQGDRVGAQAAYQRALGMFERGLGESRCVRLRNEFSHAVDVVRNNLRIMGTAPPSPEPRVPAPGTPSAADDQHCRALFDRGRTLNLEANQLRQRGDTNGARARYQLALAAFQQGAADRRCAKYSGEFTRAAQTVANNLRVLAAAPTPTAPPATAPSGASRIFAQPQFRGYRINDDGTRFAAEKFCRLNGYTRVGRIAYEQAGPPTISIMRDDISRYGNRKVFRAIECLR